MRRLLIALSSASLLVFSVAGVALAWAPPSLEPLCAEDENTYSWSISFSQFEENFNIELLWDDSTTPFDTIDFGENAHLSDPHFFTTPRGGTELKVRFASDPNAKDKATANPELCEPPPPEPPDLEFADCEEFDGTGSITVSGLEGGAFVQVNGPTVLTINADGEYPLAPGHYGYRVVWEGEPIDSGTFDIGECPPPPDEPGIEIVKTNDSGEDGEVEAGDEVTYTYRITNNGDLALQIVDVEDLIDNEPLADSEPGEEPALPACDDFDRLPDDPGNNDIILDVDETWVLTCSVELEETTSNEVCVYADVYKPDLSLLNVDQVIEPDVWDCDHNRVLVVPGGGVGGETGTPPQGGSIPDTAAAIPSQSSPIATLAFGMLLVSSLGALAYANVRAARRR